MAEHNTEVDDARAAAARGDWTTVYERLRDVDPALLTALDLNALADAAWWLSRFDESIAARQKAYAACAAQGDDRTAGVLAARLAIEFFLHEEPSVAGGFLGRAQRHVRDLPECVEQGYVAMIESAVARETGRMEEGLALARRAVAFGERFADRDLLALSLHMEGLIQLGSGAVAEGLALMDEAMTSVLADEVAPYFAGIIYCALIGACLDLSDIARAGEWSDAATAWCASLPPGAPYIGMCRVNRAEVAQLRGSWSEAESEAAIATEELRGIDPWAEGSAHYQIGEIRRRIGDDAGAEAAYERAHALGREPQPGLALLRLAHGKADAAVAAMRTALAGAQEPGRRSRLLPAQVEVALAVGDVAGARAAFDELRAMTGAATPAGLLAVVATAEGAVLFAEDRVPDAAARLHGALELWQRAKAPYETARARALYARALDAGGDRDGALLERRAALAAFERLGARPDVEAMMQVLGEPDALPAGLTAREAEVLRLVCAGKTNRDIAVELVISEHTVARHLQNMYAKLGVSSRASATAFAFEHGLA